MVLLQYFDEFGKHVFNENSYKQIIQKVFKKKKILVSFQWTIHAIWETGIPDWVPKLWHLKLIFQAFFFQKYFNKKICWTSDHWFYNAWNYFEMA